MNLHSALSLSLSFMMEARIVLFYENSFCKRDEDLFQNRFFGLAVTNDSSELCFLSPSALFEVAHLPKPITALCAADLKQKCLLKFLS